MGDFFLGNSMWGITIIFAVVVLISPWWLKEQMPVGSLPGAVTSLGILGTFIGIFIGLYRFDVNNISDSIPLLLGGLRTAFLTSIVGLLTSLSLKTEFFAKRVFRINPEDVKDPEDDPRIDEVIKYLSESAPRIDNAINHLANIHKAISGDGETTLVTQIQKLRTSTADGLDELNTSFREFADKVVADSTQSLIDALTEVMKDFNAKINEQFGSNFTQLNEAVRRMLEWQEEYKEQVVITVENLNRCLQGVGYCEKLLSSLAESSLVYQISSGKLDMLLNNLNTNLKGIEDIAQNTGKNFATIESNLTRMTEGISKAAATHEKAIDKQLDTLTEGLGKATTAHKKAVDEQLNALSTAVNSLSARITQLSEESTKIVTDQLTILDKSLEEELEKALNFLGGHLVSLSEKFVKDYTLLAEALQKLMTGLQNMLNQAKRY
jgi:DNA anti-recombination protein RmuC